MIITSKSINAMIDAIHRQKRALLPPLQEACSTKPITIVAVLIRRGTRQESSWQLGRPKIHRLSQSHSMHSVSMILDNKYNSTFSMNQRASHFSLGGTSQSYGTVYKIDYPPKEAPASKDGIGANPFRGTSLSSNEKGTFATTNKVMYRAWDSSEKAKLDPAKLAELKGHHFKLGTYNPADSITTNKLYHDAKALSGEASKNQEQSKVKMRAHYHDFKQQGFTNYKSTYAQQYVPKQGDYVDRAKKSQPENAIVFGNHHIPMITTSIEAFNAKKPEPNNLKNSLQQGSSLVLGGAKREPMETINQLYFDRKEIVKSSLPQATMKELRATHFNLGAMPNQYQRQSDHYSKKSNNPDLKYDIPQYQSGTWVDKAAKFDGSTTHKRQLPAREVQPFVRAGQSHQKGIDLGSQGNYYQTQFASNYLTPSSNPNTRVVPNKQKGNVVIGEDRSGYYQTEHKSSYKVNDLNAAKHSIDPKALGKEDHFSIGGQADTSKLTVYQDEYRRDQHNKSTLFHREK